mgnify:CR=1 FL=1|jgi:hypothetical protein
MKISLKYGYVVDVDTLNPYALQREDVKGDDKVIVKDRKYYYTLGSLINALRGSGKEYLLEYVEPLQELVGVEEGTVKVVSKYFDKVENNLIYDDNLVEIDLGLFVATYTPNNRVLSFGKKLFDAEGNPIYEMDIATMTEEPKHAIRKLGYCRWVTEFIKEYVLHSMLDKHDSEVVTMDKFVKYYKEELAVLVKGAKVTKVAIKIEEDEDDLEVVEV